MKTIFDSDTLEELFDRLGKLTPDAERQWGKMSPAQMMEHTARALEMATGQKPMQQMFLGKLIGWAVKPGFIGEKPMPKNAPTGPTLVIKDDPDFELPELS